MSFQFHNPHPKVLVIGDLMADHYLWGKAERISPEAPVQILDVERETEVPGGAGNVVANLLAMGGQVEVLSVIGHDEAGQKVTAMLTALGASCQQLVLEPGRRTSRKSRLMGGHQQVLRFDSETKADITPSSTESLLAKAEALIADADIVVLSDYGKGVLTNTVCQGIISLANGVGKKVLVDPKGTDYSKYKGAYTVTPNKKEAALATGLSLKTPVDLAQAAHKLKSDLGLGLATITLSEDGIGYLDAADVWHQVPTKVKDVYDVTGAGDTVLAAFALCIANQWPPDRTCRFANLAAAVVVGKVGSATATLAEIDAMASELEPTLPGQHAIRTAEELRPVLAQLQSQGKRVVFTNGCFDILHLGHVQLLQAARSYGDVLVVGLNADESVSRLKGPSRPINPAFDRAYLLSSLACVDYAVVFDEDTPYELIGALRPDVLVKGADYTPDKVVGADLVPEVRLVPLVNGKSTTNIIHKAQGSE
jgi:D-beta-D-heptose 7-phosphate kinase/D-beta-D-heptose 1-phosphate adenosyltransferase